VFGYFEKYARPLAYMMVISFALIMFMASVLSRDRDVAHPQGGGGMRLIPTLPEPLYYVIALLFLASFIVILAFLFQGRRRKKKKDDDEFQRYYEPPKLSFGVVILLMIVAALPISFIVWLYYHPLPLTTGLQSIGERLDQIGSFLQGIEEKKPAKESFLIGYLIFTILTIIAGSTILIGLWVWLGDRLPWAKSDQMMEEEVVKQELIEAIDLSLDDLIQERDCRRAVIACYSRFEQVLRLHGLPRTPSQTPLEYMREVLRRLEIPLRSIEGLTALFEVAKFSTHPVHEDEKRSSIEHLTEIRGTLEENGHGSQ